MRDSHYISLGWGCICTPKSSLGWYHYAVKSALSLTYSLQATNDFRFQIKVGNQTDSSEAFTRCLDPTIWAYDIAEADATYIEIDAFYTPWDPLNITLGAAQHDTKKYYQLWDYPALGLTFTNTERESDYVLNLRKAVGDVMIFLLDCGIDAGDRLTLVLQWAY